MEEIIEKHSFCNTCADIQIDLESLIIPEDSGEKSDSIKKERAPSRLLLKLFKKARYNPEYLNETMTYNQYKAKLDINTLNTRKFMI
jgi:hypothetical protein